jgi:hypothetical protein
MPIPLGFYAYLFREKHNDQKEITILIQDTEITVPDLKGRGQPAGPVFRI